MINKLRLKYGMRWRNRYPTPLDYKQESRLIGALMLILFMLWLLASRLDFEAALVQEEVTKDAWQKIGLQCATQAHNGGNLGFVFDGKLIGVECQVLSDKAFTNVKGREI